MLPAPRLPFGCFLNVPEALVLLAVSVARVVVGLIVSCAIEISELIKPNAIVNRTKYGARKNT